MWFPHSKLKVWDVPRFLQREGLALQVLIDIAVNSLRPFSRHNMGSIQRVTFENWIQLAQRTFGASLLGAELILELSSYQTIKLRYLIEENGNRLYFSAFKGRVMGGKWLSDVQGETQGYHYYIQLTKTD